jgi:ppGpp synthetase/RelA/SpoT-type nucleotidyltranferase
MRSVSVSPLGSRLSGISRSWHPFNVPSCRHPKTNFAIVAKLQREKTRLTTMQDIAGLRIVVANLAAQDEAVEKLRGLTDCKVKDRRDKPSGGYRAVHIIFVVDGYPIEVQVRTKLQHYWAEVSEKAADSDPAIKYGGGPQEVRRSLLRVSKLVETLEEGRLWRDSRAEETIADEMLKVIAEVDLIIREGRQS